MQTNIDMPTALRMMSSCTDQAGTARPPFVSGSAACTWSRWPLVNAQVRANLDGADIELLKQNTGTLFRSAAFNKTTNLLRHGNTRNIESPTDTHFIVIEKSAVCHGSNVFQTTVAINGWRNPNPHWSTHSHDMTNKLIPIALIEFRLIFDFPERKYIPPFAKYQIWLDWELFIIRKQRTLMVRIIAIQNIYAIPSESPTKCVTNETLKDIVERKKERWHLAALGCIGEPNLRVPKQNRINC